MNKDIVILREVVIKLTQLLASKGIKVTQRGMKAYVEADATGKPIRVNLPMIPDNASEGLIVAIQGFLDHEVAHLLFSDFEVVKKGYELDPSIVNLHNIVEDTYIERKMHEKFPGSGYNLANLHNFFIKNITEPPLAKCTSPKEFTSVLVVPAMRAWSGQDTFKRFMDEDNKWDLIKGFTGKIGDLYKKVPLVNSTQETLDLAIEIFNALMLEGDIEEDEEEKSKSGKSGKSGSSGGGSGPGKSSKKPKGGATPGSSGGSTLGDGTSASSVSDEPGESEEYDPEEIKSESGPLSEEDEDSEEEGKGSGGSPSEKDEEDEKGSPEEDEDDDLAESWKAEHEAAGKSKEEELKPEDVKDVFGSKSFDDAISEAISKEAAEALSESEYTVFTREHDKIEPIKITEKDFNPRWLSSLEDTTRHMTGVMQKELERLMAAKSRVLYVGGFRSGKLHGPALSRLLTGDDRIFRRKTENKSKDVAVELVIDCSGSMASGGKISTACTAAFALSSVLERINIKHEVIGFTTTNFFISSYGWGYGSSALRDPSELEDEREMRTTLSKKGKSMSRTEALYMPIFKQFDERLTPQVKQRFAAAPYICPLRNNVDGECIELAGQRLLARTEKRKVMIVLSDGNPSAEGDHTAQVRKLKKVVHDMERSGVETVGIGIMDESVKQFYPKFVVLNNIRELPLQVMKRLKDILV